jgi:hypothetical protein
MHTDIFCPVLFHFILFFKILYSNSRNLIYGPPRVRIYNLKSIDKAEAFQMSIFFKCVLTECAHRKKINLQNNKESIHADFCEEYLACKNKQFISLKSWRHFSFANKKKLKFGILPALLQVL